MKRSWKTRTQVPVTYSHSFSNNLSGTFEVGRLDDSVCLSVDLSCNLRVRNKEQNGYQDACDLIEGYPDLKSIQVPEDVMKSFATACKEAPDSPRKLRVVLGRQSFDYSVARVEHSNGGGVFLTVVRPEPPRAGA
jgi:hypothetical protein